MYFSIEHKHSRWGIRPDLRLHGKKKRREKRQVFLYYHWRSVALVRMSKLNFVSYGPLIGTDLFEKKEKKILFVGLNSPIARKLLSIAIPPTLWENSLTQGKTLIHHHPARNSYYIIGWDRRSTGGRGQPRYLPYEAPVEDPCEGDSELVPRSHFTGVCRQVWKWDLGSIWYLPILTSGTVKSVLPVTYWQSLMEVEAFWSVVLPTGHASHLVARNLGW